MKLQISSGQEEWRRAWADGWGGDDVACEECGGNRWELRYAGYMTTGKCLKCGNIQVIHDG
jgi:hypothetical protein